MTCAEMGQTMGGMMGQMAGGMMGGASQWFNLIGLGVLLIVGVAVAWTIARRPFTAEDPHEILRRRFARGELSAEEFATANQTLG